MKCRPKLCQQLAAQLTTTTPPAPSANGTIWITDEVLSEAFNRYVRVSHASRRFGSHVPGPLEARRRASKRRIGCAVVGASVAPPGGDFGALFGAGGAATDISENGWSWKPPGLQVNQPLPQKKPSKLWSWNERAPKPTPEWEQLLEMPPSEEYLVENSREAFEELLERPSHDEQLELRAIRPMLEFLASSANEPKAHNTNRLIKWLAERPSSSTAWQAITDAICDKIQLATIEEDELIEVIRALPQARAWQQHRSACDELHQSYFSFWTSLDGQGCSESPMQQTIFKMFAKTTRDMEGCLGLIELVSRVAVSAGHGNLLSKNIFATLQAISEFDRKDSQELLSRFALSIDEIPFNIKSGVLASTTSHIIGLRQVNKGVKNKLAELWLMCLESTSSFSPFSATMGPVYTRLAAHFKISDLPAHFRNLRSVDIVELMLRIWLPVADAKTSEKSVSRASTKHKNYKTLQPSLRDSSAADLEDISAKFRSFNTEKKQGQRSVWENLLRAYSSASVCYDTVATEVLAISRAIDSPGRVHHIFNCLLQSPHLAIPTSAAVTTLKYFLDKQLLGHALSIFRNVPSIAITDVPDLPVALVKYGRYRTDAVMELLLRQPDPVPMEWRAIAKLDLTQEHIDAVHIIAHDIAHASSLDPRPALRHVWAYYRFLQDRGAPLHALMSRAMVHAGIVRPLNERIWVPDERLEYILHIVEQIEGVEMRENVEDIILSRRTTMHDEVLAKRQYLRERAARSDSTSDLARETRYRLKKWAKKSPLPTGDGSFYVPEDEPVD